MPPASTQIENVASYISRFVEPLLTGGLVLVFTIFMLINREDLRERLIHLAGHGRLDITTQALDEASDRISRFLLAQAVVNIGYGVAVSGGLWVIGHTLGRGAGGFPNVVLWGLLCAVLRFIPYVGIWIAAAMPLFISFALPGLGAFIGTATMFGIYEVVVSQFVEPYLYGSSTGMSALAILVSAVFWTWLWGPIGLLLSTPLTVCLVVVGKYVPQLQFLDVLLGDEPVLEPPVRIYQRLLALDDEEATELARSYLREMSLEKLFDDVLLPALAQAERDRHQGKLDDTRHKFARETLRSMVEEMGETARSEQIQEAAAKTVADAKEGTDASASAAAPVRRLILPQGCVVNVVLLPAKDEADEIAALMLAQVLGLDGYSTFSVSPTALAAEMMDQVEQTKADVVVVSALPPAAIAHGRYLCKRLQERHSEVPTIVGLWTITGDPKKMKLRLACPGTAHVVSTISAAREQIEQFAHSLIARPAPQPDAELATVN